MATIQKVDVFTRRCLASSSQPSNPFIVVRSIEFVIPCDKQHMLKGIGLCVYKFPQLFPIFAIGSILWQ